MKTKLQTYETRLRKIRQRVFDYPESKDEQVARILAKLKSKVIELHGTADNYHPFYAAEGWY